MHVAKQFESEAIEECNYVEGECGMCVECKEWTDVGRSCCGRGVAFEGGFVADCECNKCLEE